MKRINHVLLIVMILGLANLASAGQKLCIVTHPSSNVASLTVADVARIYLGKQKTIGGVKVSPYMLSGELKETSAFKAGVAKMSSTEWDDYWMEQKLSGGASQPKMTNSTEDLQKFMVVQKGIALGYTFGPVNPESFKTLLEIDVEMSEN